MTRTIFILTLLCAGFTVKAQNFAYSVTTDSVAWNELNSQTILNTNNSAWNFSYKIPIGFSFNFCGRDFDSLTIETNGYVVFDSERNYALTAFSGVGDCVDTTGNHAVLGYETSGSSGNHILKIQYKSCGINNNNAESQSWQIWLMENGAIEFRIGPGTLRTNTVQVIEFNETTQQDSTYTLTEIDSTQQYRVGLINMNMDSPDRGLMLGGNPSSPLSQHVNDTYPEMLYLDCIPANGYRYTFSPSN